MRFLCSCEIDSWDPFLAVLLPIATPNKAFVSSSMTSLNLFWELAKPAAEARIIATKSLLESISREREETRSSADAAQPLSANITYCLERLVKGLISSHSAARQGYSLALTEVLSTFPFIETRAILELMEKHLAVPSSANKQVRFIA